MPPPESEPTHAIPRVWLVDDSHVEASISQRGLGMAGVVVFHDGASMLERLLFEKPLPDVVVLDWHMPEMSGLDVCRAIRGQFDSARLPVLILTASGERNDLVAGLDAGANDFLRKPFLTAELNARIAALVRSKRLHEELTRLEADLRDEASFREQFLAILAHDLRQPLSVFSMGAETLASSVTSPELRAKIAESMSRASDRMARMIAELLDFSRARPASGMPIRPRAARLDIVAHEVIEQVRLAHPSRPIDFSVEGNCTGTWDPDRLAQVVSNLVENAVANSPPDTRVGLRIQTRDGRIELAVENHGTTIPPDLLANIFGPFRERRPSAGGGLGLGLFIVAQIVRAHGGTVAAASANGLTRFAVSLPCTEPAAAAPG